MTDKVQKIEKWIKEKIACWCNESQCEVPELPKQIIEGKILALREMLSFINSLQEEPANEIDFEKELYKAFGQVKDFTLGLQIAKRFYDMGKNHQEPVSKEWIEELRTKLDSLSKEEFEQVWEKYGAEEKEELVSEDLEQAAADYEEEKWKAGHPEDTYNSSDIIKAVKYGAKWQKEQMMKKAIDTHCFGFQGAALFSFRLPADNYLVGSKVKVIVIKED